MMKGTNIIVGSATICNVMAIRVQRRADGDTNPEANVTKYSDYQQCDFEFELIYKFYAGRNFNVIFKDVAKQHDLRQMHSEFGQSVSDL